MLYCYLKVGSLVSPVVIGLDILAGALHNNLCSIS